MLSSEKSVDLFFFRRTHEQNGLYKYCILLVMKPILFVSRAKHKRGPHFSHVTESKRKIFKTNKKKYKCIYKIVIDLYQQSVFNRLICL